MRVCQCHAELQAFRSQTVSADSVLHSGMHGMIKSSYFIKAQGSFLSLARLLYNPFAPSLSNPAISKPFFLTSGQFDFLLHQTKKTLSI
jgi:hypothetical protein